MLCIINGENFHSFTKNIRIGNSGVSCHIINNDTGLYDITKINNWYRVVWVICLPPRKASFA